MKNTLLISFSALSTLILALLIIQWLAPGLLGLPVDLRLVQVDKKVPPFFEGVFRREDLASPNFILQDPFTGVRSKPFYPDADGWGPNDLLGFRNKAVPTVADIIMIGDSQTYGNNAFLGDNWPQQTMQNLPKQFTHYSMAVGGWSAPQYLNMFKNANLFRPRVVIVAFYTGNDPLESFMQSYGSPYWSFLIPDKTLSTDDVPAFKWSWPPTKSDSTEITFADGLKQTFTPGVRLKSNIDHPVIHAGYQILKNVAAEITREAISLGVQPVFTIIPTKELVYSRKVKDENIHVSEDYDLLVQRESINIADLQQAILSNTGARYIDVIGPLQSAALNARPLYPGHGNGHPIAYGYEVIGLAIAAEVNVMLPHIGEGFVGVQPTESTVKPYLLRDGILYHFPTRELVVENGWQRPDGDLVSERDLATYPKKIVETIDIKKYGPR